MFSFWAGRLPGKRLAFRGAMAETARREPAPNGGELASRTAPDGDREPALRIWHGAYDRTLTTSWGTTKLTAKLLTTLLCLPVERESVTVPPEDKRPPVAAALEWVSRITTVALEMVLPGIGGQWLDRRWGTNFLGLAGFAVGLTVGIWHLIQMTRPRPPRQSPADTTCDRSGASPRGGPNSSNQA